MHAHKLKWPKLKQRAVWHGGSDSGVKTGCGDEQTGENKVNELK